MSDTPHPTERNRLRSTLQVCQKLFLTAGVLALIIWAGTMAYSALGSAYDDWAFNRSQQQQRQLVQSGSAAAKRVAQKAASNRRQSAVSEKAKAKANTKEVRKRGSRVARLQIPSVGLSVMVLEGTKESVLRRGAGHIDGTAYPGDVGNMGIAGHRDRLFRKLKGVSKNDWIFVETQNTKYRYRVHDIMIVNPKDVYVLKATPQPTLTLVTCYPFYYIGHAPQRYIIKAQLVPGAS